MLVDDKSKKQILLVSAILWWMLTCVRPCWGTKVIGQLFEFTKVDTDTDSLTLLHSLPNIRSILDCSRACRQTIGQQSECEGYEFKSLSNTCRLYTGDVIESSNPVNGSRMLKLTNYHNVYSPQRRLRLNTKAYRKRFDISGRPRYYYITLNGVTGTYKHAIDQCANNRGHLLHIDDPEEHVPLALTWGYFNRSYNDTWVGVIKEHGQWVSQKYGTPLDLNVWTWGTGAPSANRFENCAVLRQTVTPKVLYNRRSDTLFHYMCEWD